MSDKPNFEFEDISPKLIAAFDQMGAIMAENVAPLFAQYYKALLAQGLPDHVATEMVVAYQFFFMTRITSGNSGE